MAGRRPSTATVLFTDVVASTAFRVARGDDLADEVRRRHDEAIRAAAAEHLGEVVKGTGDGVMVVFPAAAQGLSGAVAIQRAVHRLERSLRDASLAIRVGVSAGDIVWEDDDCYGTPVVEAARLCDAAEPGEILVSDIVRMLAGSRSAHVLEPRGVMSLKGLGDVTVFEVRWESETGGSRIALPPPLDTGDTLPLIGRETALDAVMAAFKEAADGRPQLVVISGEPGVGKTRLAAEAARAAHAMGAVVLFGRCDEDLAVPYQPFVEAFSTYALACDDDRLLEQLGAGGGELTRLVPALAQRFGERLGEPVRADAETERFRLFEASAAFLHAVAADDPLVLVIDDAHWGARPTLLLLRHIVRARHDERMLVVVTYRDTDLSRTHPLAEVLADLRREPAVERVSLRGLSPEEVTDLVTAAAGHDLDDSARSFAADVHTETEGNPFFVGQVLRHLAESGAIRVENDRWVVDRTSGVGIPEGVREVIGKRLSRLSASANDLLAAAAVIGREFDRSLLREASGVDAEQVLDALEEAETTRLIVPLGGRDDRLAFTHALVRSTLYEEIATTRRLRIHRRVADALEARAARGVPCVEELAHHSREAAALGDVDRAVRWSREAARAATQRLAYEAAASHYQGALEVLDPADAAHLEPRAELRTELARSLRTAGSIAASREVALQAVGDARAAGRFDVFLDATLVIAGDRGWSEAGRVDREIIELFEEGLALVAPGDSSLTAKAMARLASELYFDVPSADRRQQLTADALAMAERVGDDDTRVFVTWCSLWGSWVAGNAAERHERASELIEIGRRNGNRFHELVGLMWGAAALAELGDGEGLRTALVAGRSIAEDLRIPEWVWVSGVLQSAVELMEQRYDDALATAAEAMRLGSELGSETAAQMFGITMFVSARARGGIEELLPMFVDMVERYPLIPGWRCALATLYRDLGMFDEARAIFDELASQRFATLPFDANWLIAIASVALAADLVTDLDQLAMLHELIAPYADCVVYAGFPAEISGSMHLYLMVLTAALGRRDEAEEHHRLAQETHARMRCPSASLNADIEWARILARGVRPGDESRAEALARSCIDRANAVGATRLAAIAGDILRAATSAAGG